MKSIRIVGLLAIVFILSTPLVFAGEYDEIMTDHRFNGRYFSDERIGEEEKIMFVYGLLEALHYTQAIEVEGMGKGQMYTTILKYYENNPKDITKPIVRVILEQFKPKNVRLEF